MQTVLGAGGQIADELTRELHRNHTTDIRLVSRKPKHVNDTDQLVAADLMETEATAKAVAGSEIVYLTVGLPMDSALMAKMFPVMMANAIAACRQHGAKLVFFDNTYMYPRTSTPQTEETAFDPVGPKATVRAQVATLLLEAMDAGTVEAMICRAPEFYGPGKTQSLTNAVVLDRIAAGKRPFVPLTARTKRTLIWTPDASSAMARLGNTPDAYGQTWHLPVDHDRLTYEQLLAVAGEVTGRKIGYTTLPRWVFGVGGRFNLALREAEELLPRYRHDNIFDSTKFHTRFPDFEVTTYRQGVTKLLSAS